MFRLASLAFAGATVAAALGLQANAAPEGASPPTVTFEERFIFGQRVLFVNVTDPDGFDDIVTMKWAVIFDDGRKKKEQVHQPADRQGLHRRQGHRERQALPRAQRPGPTGSGCGCAWWTPLASRRARCGGSEARVSSPPRGRHPAAVRGAATVARPQRRVTTSLRFSTRRATLIHAACSVAGTRASRGLRPTASAATAASRSSPNRRRSSRR